MSVSWSVQRVSIVVEALRVPSRTPERVSCEISSLARIVPSRGRVVETSTGALGLTSILVNRVRPRGSVLDSKGLVVGGEAGCRAECY